MPLFLANTQPDGNGSGIAVKANILTGRLEIENYVWNGSIWVPETQPSGSGSAGTEYTEGVTVSSGAIGRIGLWRDGSGVLHVVDISNGYPVNQVPLAAATDKVDVAWLNGAPPLQTFTAIAAGTHTNSNDSGSKTNKNAKGLLCYLWVTAVPGVASTITLKLQGQDPTTLNWQTVGAGSIVTGNVASPNTMFPAMFMPGITLPSGWGGASVPIPPTYRIQVAHSSATDSYGYSVGVQEVR